MKWAFVGLLAAVVLSGCTTPIGYMTQDPLFEANDLEGRNVALLPVRSSLTKEEVGNMDRSIAITMERIFKGANIIEGQRVEALLGERMQGYHANAAAFDNPLGEPALGIRNELYDRMDALYLVVPEVQSVSYDRLEAGDGQSERLKRSPRKRISRTTINMRVSIFSTTDGALVWRGETAGDSSNVQCASRERPEALESEYPPYPAPEEAVQAALGTALLNIRGTSLSRRLQFALESEPYC